ncbi:MAG: acyl-CoA dehydrogenase [Spirochaetes bacterium]|nr:acyl-CoA dehydrogenase [Spirochaetota bacterium]
MALNPLVDSRDVRFTLFEMLEADKLVKYPQFSDHDKDIFEDVLNLAERLAIDTFYPANAEGDKEGGAKYDPDTCSVKTPEVIKNAWNAYVEAGFTNMRVETEYGGMGIPEIVTNACSEYFQAANFSILMYANLISGASYLINKFGTDEQRKLYAQKMTAGEWGGSMSLTEPEAGSDLNNTKTKAVKQSDGTYLITGQKMFITGGEHDLTDNIIHIVLAIIEGHPKGTKGISTFIVPKYLVNPDGSKGARNDVVCSGIEHKMGIKSSVTASINFGDNGKCVGYLIGKEMEGMKIMFYMMNSSRIEVGFHALGPSSAAYMHAITYARNRKQGSHFKSKGANAPMVSIIEHPDVQRMLLWMKSHVEGMRMLAYFLSRSLDLSRVEKGDEAKTNLALLDLLTPIHKAGISDHSWLVTAEAIQVYGGYGYSSDYPVEQFARDAKVNTVFEGTNGIQSIDLTFRKILNNKEQYNYKIWKERVSETLSKARGIVDDKYIGAVGRGMEKLDDVIKFFQEALKAGKEELVYMSATPFQQSMYIVVLSWLHLWSLTLTVPKFKALAGNAKGDELQKLINSNSEAAYYYGKNLSSQYFIGTEIPKVIGKIESIVGGEDAVIKTSPAVFTGALEE